MSYRGEISKSEELVHKVKDDSAADVSRYLDTNQITHNEFFKAIKMSVKLNKTFVFEKLLSVIEPVSSNHEKLKLTDPNLLPSAISNDNFEIVEMLLANNRELVNLTSNDWTPFMYAVEMQNYKIITLIGDTSERTIFYQTQGISAFTIFENIYNKYSYHNDNDKNIKKYLSKLVQKYKPNLNDDTKQFYLEQSISSPKFQELEYKSNTSPNKRTTLAIKNGSSNSKQDNLTNEEENTGNPTNPNNLLSDGVRTSLRNGTSRSKQSTTSNEEENTGNLNNPNNLLSDGVRTSLKNGTSRSKQGSASNEEENTSNPTNPNNLLNDGVRTSLRNGTSRSKQSTTSNEEGNTGNPNNLLSDGVRTSLRNGTSRSKQGGQTNGEDTGNLLDGGVRTSLRGGTSSSKQGGQTNGEDTGNLLGNGVRTSLRGGTSSSKEGGASNEENTGNLLSDGVRTSLRGGTSSSKQGSASNEEENTGNMISDGVRNGEGNVGRPNNKIFSQSETNRVKKFGSGDADARKGRFAVSEGNSPVGNVFKNNSSKFGRVTQNDSDDENSIIVNPINSNNGLVQNRINRENMFSNSGSKNNNLVTNEETLDDEESDSNTEDEEIFGNKSNDSDNNSIVISDENDSDIDSEENDSNVNSDIDSEGEISDNDLGKEKLYKIIDVYKNLDVTYKGKNLCEDKKTIFCNKIEERNTEVDYLNNNKETIDNDMLRTKINRINKLESDIIKGKCNYGKENNLCKAKDKIKTQVKKELRDIRKIRNNNSL